MAAMSRQEETHWLTKEQQHIWRQYLAATSWIDTFLEEALRPFDLGLGEYEILVELSEAPEHRMRMSDLAAAVRQSRSRLTHTAKRLEAKKLIARGHCPDDRRGVVATLTPAGYDLLRAAAPTHVQSVRDCFIDVVPRKEFEALGRAMAAVLENKPLV